jgi:hypothetical protein
MAGKNTGYRSVRVGGGVRDGGGSDVKMAANDFKCTFCASLRTRILTIKYRHTLIIHLIVMRPSVLVLDFMIIFLDSFRVGQFAN